MGTSWCVSQWHHTNEFALGHCTEMISGALKTFEVLNKQRKEQHRIAMIEFRLHKKNKRKEMQREHRRLERTMKVLVASERCAAARASAGDVALGTVKATLRDLIVTKEALRKQNAALDGAIKRHEKIRSIARDASIELGESAAPSHDSSGWRVDLDGEATSFHFHPLTRDEFDATMARFDVELANEMSFLGKADSLFGWEALKAPLDPSSLEGNRLLVRTRVSKRFRCSLDLYKQVLCPEQKDLTPVITSPLGWGLCQRSTISSEVLQELDQNSTVFVHNIPGPEKNVQYLFQVWRTQWKMQDGRRKLTMSMAVTDSDANRRSRDAEGLQSNIEWATEGGLHVSVTEIEENLIEVSCDHWASSDSKLHAEHLMIQWMQLAVWWEQRAVPSNLLLQSSGR